LGKLEKKGHINNYHPKDVKFVMEEIRKELKSIETTGIRMAMKEVPANAR
jgi:hypothetical protein